MPSWLKHVGPYSGSCGGDGTQRCPTAIEWIRITPQISNLDFHKGHTLWIYWSPKANENQGLEECYVGTTKSGSYYAINSSTLQVELTLQGAKIPISTANPSRYSVCCGKKVSFKFDCSCRKSDPRVSNLHTSLTGTYGRIAFYVPSFPLIMFRLTKRVQQLPSWSCRYMTYPKILLKLAIGITLYVFLRLKITFLTAVILWRT